MGLDKNFFKFSWFDELEVGDVFKFTPVIRGDTPSKFYTVYSKDNSVTKYNTTYGKIKREEMENDANREIMVFPYRKRF